MNRLLQLFAKAAIRLGRLLVWLYYSPIKIVGTEHLPKDGPVLLVSNHANSMIDPLLLGWTVRRRIRFLARASAFRIPVIGVLLRWLGVIPVFRSSGAQDASSRNAQCYSEVLSIFSGGGAVGMFPEGRTHDARSLSQVDASAAHLIMDAMAAGLEGLKVVPIGINYDDKRVFRSAVWVEVGEVVDAKSWMDDALGVDQQREFISEKVGEVLRKVVIHLDDPDLEPFLTDLEYLDPALTASGKQRVFSLQQRKTVADAVNYFVREKPDSFASVGRSLAAHRGRLAEYGLKVDSDILNYPGWQRYGLLIGQSIRLCFGLLPVLCGVLQNLPPFLMGRLLLRWMPDHAASQVALLRIAVSLPIFLFWYLFTAVLMATYFLPWVVVFWLLVTPVTGLFALRYFRSMGLVFKAWALEVKMLFQRKSLQRLREGQEKLKQRFQKYGDEFESLRESLPVKKPRWVRRPEFHFAVLSSMFVLGFSFFMLCAIRMGFRDSTLEILIRPAPDYSQMPGDELRKALESDEQRLLTVISEMEALALRMRSVKHGFDTGRFSYYSDEDNDQISQLMLTYLNCRRELLDLILLYRARHTIQDRELELRASLLDLAAACQLYAYASQMIVELKGYPQMIAKLNEGDPAWGVPAGLCDAIRDRLNHEPNLDPLRRALRDYELMDEDYRAHGLVEELPQARFHRVIQEVEMKDPQPGFIAGAAREARELKDDLMYHGQSTISQLMGNTRVRERVHGPRLRPSQLDKVREQVKPGDILLERQDWYLSRAFMPGYWAHAALYVGTPEEVEAMGLKDHPWVKPHWDDFKKQATDGDVYSIIEAVPAGVRFTTMEHCMGIADSAVVLRPSKLSDEEKREAIVRAFRHVGKPYDFEFDFFSADKLVCTELVARAYADSEKLRFETVNVMGRQTIPPTEMVRKYAVERGRDDAQLEMVIFYDGHAGGKRCVKRGAKDLADTVNRNGMTWFNSLD